jgi:hypothetical protein
MNIMTETSLPKINGDVKCGRVKEGVGVTSKNRMYQDLYFK